MTLWTLGVREGQLTENQFVAVLSTNQARIYGAYPRKGAEYLLEFPLELHDGEGFDAKGSAPIYVLPREAMTAVKGAAVPRGPAA